MRREREKSPVKTVIVTGAAGFIGGQTMLALRDSMPDINIIGIDRAPLPRHLTSIPTKFLHEDYISDYVLNTMSMHQPRAIIHCGATSLVGPSVRDPAGYFHNNFEKTRRMLDHLRANHLNTKVIVSSSSSVYGNPEILPCTEQTPTNPVSPYGQSKLMVDQMLHSYHVAYGLDYVAFRYFNVCGADPDVRHGQPPRATHIIARVLESLRDDTEFVLNGADYDTPDGTCVRDHVHVADVARAHVMALDPGFNTGVYNVGINHGTSNQEILDLAQNITGRRLKLTVAARRSGDPERLQADASKLISKGWSPGFGVEDMIRHAWAWYNR
jgi:UDP-glucose 4-epimerase